MLLCPIFHLLLISTHELSRAGLAVSILQKRKWRPSNAWKDLTEPPLELVLELPLDEWPFFSWHSSSYPRNCFSFMSFRDFSCLRHDEISGFFPERSKLLPNISFTLCLLWVLLEKTVHVDIPLFFSQGGRSFQRRHGPWSYCICSLVFLTTTTTVRLDSPPCGCPAVGCHNA